MTRSDPNQMGFFEHLEELRGRILKSLVIWLVVFVACFAMHERIFDILAAPLIEINKSEHVFAAFDIKEPFLANLKASFWVSVILSSGVFFYQFWMFIAPGLTKSEKRFAIPFLIFMTLFFMLGCWFSFTQVFPAALEYLMSWNSGLSLNAYTRSSYLSLLFALVIGMGACFEMPMVIFFLAKIGLVTPRFLLAKFKYAVIIIFIIAAVITPTPDPWIQTFLAGPMLGLYLLGVGAAYFVRKKKDKPEKDEGLEDAERSIEGNQTTGGDD